MEKTAGDGLDSNLPQSLPEEAGAATAINIEVFNACVGSSVLIGGPIIGSAEPHIFAEASGGLVILRLIVILVTGESRAR